jgi:NADPH-dependent 2,4-dienoyl-CoA reductase/sulfur reductase-like enzyme
VVVVGAGPAGCELAGSLIELMHRAVARDFKQLDRAQCRVVLLDAVDRVLPAMAADLSADAAAYLQRAFGHPSRSRLTSYADLVAYLTTLDGLEVGQDPAVVPVPLRRRDLLAQCDGLLEQLGWDDERGRAFLATQLGASSRRQLSDSQLLQFNMLLEGALIEARSDGVPPPGP